MPCLRLLGILCTLIFLMACTATTSEPTPDIPSTVAAPVQLQLAATPAPPPIPVIDVPRTHATPIPSPFLLRAATLEPAIVIPPSYPVVAPPTPVITPFFASPPEPPATPIPYPTVPVEVAVMATMEPFPTALPVLEHPVAWKVRNPRDGLYSVNLPVDWEHESRFLQNPGGPPVSQETFANPAYTALLMVIDYPPQDGYDVSDAFTNLVAQFNEVTGFEVVTIDQVSDEVIRVIFRYDDAGPDCGVVNFYGILAVTDRHSFQWGLDICSTFGTDSYRTDFAAQVIEGFTYPGEAP